MWNAKTHPCAALLGFCARWISGAQVRWIGCRAERRPRVYFANHSSHLDFVVLWAALPADIREQTSPVAAQEYWGSRLRCRLARLFRPVLIARGKSSPLAGREDLARLLAELDGGRSLVLFPEGTRGDGCEVAEFKSGLYELCRSRPELEAVPVYLENLHRILPKGEFLPLPLARGRVTFGPPLRFHRGEGHREFLSRARQALRALRSS